MRQASRHVSAPPELTASALADILHPQDLGDPLFQQALDAQFQGHRRAWTPPARTLQLHLHDSLIGDIHQFDTTPVGDKVGTDFVDDRFHFLSHTHSFTVQQPAGCVCAVLFIDCVGYTQNTPARGAPPGSGQGIFGFVSFGDGIRTGLVRSLRERWWPAPVCGLAMVLCLPPFSHESSILLAPLPLLSFVVLVPLMLFATHARTGRAALLCWLYGIAASAAQYYWIVFDTAEGVWHLIVMGVMGLTLLFGAWYLGLGMLFRLCWRRIPAWTPLVFPCAWVVCEYARTLGDISFPWTLIGYALAPLSALAQGAALGGVYLLSLSIVAVNVAVWQWVERPTGRTVRVRSTAVAVGLLVVLVAYGAMRLWLRHSDGPQLRVSNLQMNLDHLHRGKSGIDTAFAVAESLVYRAAVDSPDLMVLPESALLCYLVRHAERVLRVLTWVDSTRVPLILGSLHWERGARGSPYKYLVYNTAFLVDRSRRLFHPYFKMKLVPFSEALPFEGVLPILSRVNLGEADFARGHDKTVFAIGDSVRAVPLICYEVIYPAFVRERLDTSANLLVNITNDGWFGRSPGPYHHAAMARVRCIENGVSMVRCANTGVSELVDQYGLVRCRTGMFERVVQTGTVPLARVPTLYAMLGDWVVWLSLVACAAGAARAVLHAVRTGRGEG